MTERGTPFTARDLQALRALRRLAEIRFRGFDEHADADRAFDGGEWSDPAIFAQGEKMLDECVAVVADRYDMLRGSLAELFMQWDYIEADMAMDALYRRDSEQVRLMCGDNPAKEEQ